MTSDTKPMRVVYAVVFLDVPDSVGPKPSDAVKWGRDKLEGWFGTMSKYGVPVNIKEVTLRTIEDPDGK